MGFVGALVIIAHLHAISGAVGTLASMCAAQVTLMLSCVLGLTINHSTFICTRYNDPLTTSVAGSLKNIIMTLIGAVSFGDFVYAKWNVVGLGVSMAGAIWYATRAAIKV